MDGLPALLGGVCGVIGALLLLLLLFLLLRRRRRAARKDRLLREDSVRMVTPPPPRAAVAGIPVQVQSAAGITPAEDPSGFLQQQYGRRQSHHHAQDLLREALAHSLREAGVHVPPMVGRVSGTTSPSVSEVSSLASEEEAQQITRALSVRPRMDFHVVYTVLNSTLTVCVNRLVNLPLKYRGRPFLVRVTALGRQQQTAPIVQPPEQPEHQQPGHLLTFGGVAVEWLGQGQLTCALYVRHFSSLTEKLVGEGSVRLAELRLGSGTPVACSLVFDRPARKKNLPLQPSVTSPDDVAGITPPMLGQLVVSLKYHPASSKMTIFVRRGENLPESRGLTSPEYYVLVTLLRSGDVVSYQESRRVSGHSPVWNQSLHFHIHPEEVDIHWIQCIVMASRLYAKDRRVGFCQLGPDTTALGAQQWQESLRERRADLPKCHPLLPLPD